MSTSWSELPFLGSHVVGSTSYTPTRDDIERYRSMEQIKKQASQLTTAEKVAKWVAKTLTLILAMAAVGAVTLLFQALIPVPILGGAVGVSLASGPIFMIAMAALVRIDEYFAERAQARFLSNWE